MGVFSKPGGGVTADSTDTLTNKTIDGDNNTIQDIAVSSLKSGTDGELITWDASGNATTVGAGTSGQVLTSNGAGAAPTFQAAGGGDAVLLSTQTASASSELDFELSAGYAYYELVYYNVTPTADLVSLDLRMSTDGGSTFDTGTNYDYLEHCIDLDSTVTEVNNGNNTASTIRFRANVGNSTNEILQGAVKIFNAAASAYTMVTGQGIHIDRNALGIGFTNYGIYQSTTAVDYIRLFCNGTTIATGTFKLYGYN